MAEACNFGGAKMCLYDSDKSRVTRPVRARAGPIGAAIQLLLFVLAILALVYKRHHEHPRRPLRVWSFDVSKQARAGGTLDTVCRCLKTLKVLQAQGPRWQLKEVCDAPCPSWLESASPPQGFSSIAAHISGMAWSHVISRGAEGLSECSWYVVVFTVDTIAGVALSLVFHRGAHDTGASTACSMLSTDVPCIDSCHLPPTRARRRRQGRHLAQPASPSNTRVGRVAGGERVVRCVEPRAGLSALPIRASAVPAAGHVTNDGPLPRALAPSPSTQGIHRKSAYGPCKWQNGHSASSSVRMIRLLRLLRRHTQPRRADAIHPRRYSAAHLRLLRVCDPRTSPRHRRWDRLG